MPKIQIRSGIFETNSSSVHSVTVATEDIYRAWQRGEVMFCPSPTWYNWEIKETVQTEQFLPTAEALKKNLKILDMICERNPDYEAEANASYRKALEEALEEGRELEFHLRDPEAFREIDFWWDNYYVSYSDFWASVESCDYESTEEHVKVLGSDVDVVSFGYSGYNG